MGFLSDDSTTVCGKTQHFLIIYDKSLSKADGQDRANGLLATCEKDFALMLGWFEGVTFAFTFPIHVRIADSSTGLASWNSPSGILNIPHIYIPIITIELGNGKSVDILRFMLVAEVTEMLMFSKKNGWGFDGQGFLTASDEGSKGEGLSRFLGVQFQIANGLGTIPPPGVAVAMYWLNSERQNFIELNKDENKPGAVIGCATLFIYFLHDQLGFSIEKIINAGASTLAGGYQKLTGKNDGWNKFINLVNSHYPSDNGMQYYPNGDIIFPVSEIIDFSAPRQTSWFENTAPDTGYSTNIKIQIDIPAKADIEIRFVCDDPKILDVPDKTLILKGDQSLVVPIKALMQPDTFSKQVVTLIAMYAGKGLSASVEVVRPENLELPELIISPINQITDDCHVWAIEGQVQKFGINNINVFKNQLNLTYRWSVSGVTISEDNLSELTINPLPVAGTAVVINVVVENNNQIHSQGSYSFTTMSSASAALANMQCRLKKLKQTLDLSNPTPTGGDPLKKHLWKPSLEQLTEIENHAKEIAAVAKKMQKSNS